MAGTLACHIVWTTYGTWLPGDPRGHWSAAPNKHGTWCKPHGAPNPGDVELHRKSEALMRQTEVALTEDEIDMVAKEIGCCCDQSDWSIYAAAIEPTHVHLMQSPSPRSVDGTIRWLKGRCTKALHGHGRPGVIWTEGRWREFLFDEDHFVRVLRYIQEHNLRRGLPASPYPWITPPAL